MGMKIFFYRDFKWIRMIDLLIVYLLDRFFIDRLIDWLIYRFQWALLQLNSQIQTKIMQHQHIYSKHSFILTIV